MLSSERIFSRLQMLFIHCLAPDCDESNMMSQNTESELDKMVQALSLGLSNKKSCQHKEALKHFNKALRIAQKNGFKKGEGSALSNLLFSLSSLRRYEEAIDYGEQGLELATEIGDKELEGVICDNLGASYLEHEKPCEALKYLKRGCKIALEYDKKEMLALAWLNLGAAYISMGNYDNSIKCSKKSMELLMKQNDERQLAKCYCNLAKAYTGLGKYHDAIVCDEKYLEIARRMGDKFGEANALIDLASLHKLTCNLVKANDYNKQSFSLATEIGDKLLQAKCLGNIASLLNMKKQFKEALPYHFQCLKLAEEMGDKRTQASVICNIARCHKELKSYHESNHFYNISLNIAKEIVDKETDAFIYYNIGTNHYLEGDFQQAISWLEKCLHVALDTGSKYWEGNVYDVLGAAFYSLAKHNQECETYQLNLSKSEEYLRKAFDCHNHIFKNLELQDQLKNSFGDHFLSTCKLLVSLLIETGRIQEALFISDHGRARSLGDRLTFDYGFSHQEEYISTKQLTYPDVEAVVSDGTFTLLHYCLLLVKKGNDVVWVVKKATLNLLKLVCQQELPNVDLQGYEDLSAEYLIISAALSKVYNVMNIGSMRCENRSLDLYIQANVHQKRSDLPISLPHGDDSGQEFDPLEVLYNCLMASVSTFVQSEEIVIVPDGPMYLIPFAALKDPDTGQYLSDTKRIRIAPSIAVLKLLQESPTDHHSQHGALIIGDPTVGEVILRGKKTTLPPLPCARQEAEIIALTLRRQPLTGEAATKDEVLKRLQEGAALIHIAAHGSSDNGEIALAPNPSPNRQGPPEEKDYLLTIKEVQETGVRAKLVVLSCCYGGRGEVRAEGMIGLCRAFLVAGARAVVASLWAIDDSATLSFMLSFYTNLNRGESASVSLHKAMKEIRNEGYSEPRYWAPFFLIGDDVTLRDKN